jgi:L-ectoine synthase
MIVVDVMKMQGTDREVECPNGGFSSLRMLLARDGMGFTMTRTTIHPTREYQRWHYKNHLEACYCIKGKATLKDAKGHKWEIKPGVMYALDKNDEHYFKADLTTILICVFNPPLTGAEVHQADGSYAKGK